MPHLSGKEKAALREALIAALPTPEDWEEALALAYDSTLDRLSARAKLPARVNEILNWTEARWVTDSLVAVAVDMAPKNDDLKRAQELLKSKISALGLDSSARFESIVRGRAPIEDVEAWRAKMQRSERAVCRIEENLTGQPVHTQPLGTGFLIGDDLILTNHHVVELYILGNLLAKYLTFRFDYKLEAGAPAPDVTYGAAAEKWLVQWSPKTELDYALVRLNKSPGRQPLIPTRVQYCERDLLMIIQHPKAAPLKFAQGTITNANAGNAGGAPRIAYDVNTQDGSSGAPCFLSDWSLIGLHHRGDINHNEGIPMSAITDDLAAKRISFGVKHDAATSA